MPGSPTAPLAPLVRMALFNGGHHLALAPVVIQKGDQLASPRTLLHHPRRPPKHRRGMAGQLRAGKANLKKLLQVRVRPGEDTKKSIRPQILKMRGFSIG